MKGVKGRDERVAKAYLRSVVIEYDSRWALADGVAKTARFQFRRPLTNRPLGEAERAAYQTMFIKEVMKMSAKWYITVDAVFFDGVTEYVEGAELISDSCKLQEAAPLFEQLRDEVKNSGNPRHYMYYKWRAEVYSNQDKKAIT